MSLLVFPSLKMGMSFQPSLCDRLPGRFFFFELVTMGLRVGSVMLFCPPILQQDKLYQGKPMVNKP